MNTLKDVLDFWEGAHDSVGGQARADLELYIERHYAKLRQWVDDLQSGMYINCVYCGHRYGPQEDTPVSMAAVLEEHIEQCPDHPLSELKAENQRLRNEPTVERMFALQEEVSRLEELGLQKAARIQQLEAFARDIAVNWDCDPHSHRYGTSCRKCDAEKVLDTK